MHNVCTANSSATLAPKKHRSCGTWTTKHERTYAYAAQQ